MTFNGPPETAKLAQDAGSFRLDREHARTGVVVHVVHVPFAAVGPAAGTIDEPRGVELLREGEILIRLELPPAFIERHPADDAGVVLQALDDGCPFLAEDLLGLRGTFDVWRIRPDVLVAAGHVLPDHQPELVAVV